MDLLSLDHISFSVPGRATTLARPLTPSLVLSKTCFANAANGSRGKERRQPRVARRTPALPLTLKGGDPAAPSGTATLLRLHPPRRAHLRQRPPSRVNLPTSGAPDSDGVTGGVYKARERIHRAVLMRDY